MSSFVTVAFRVRREHAEEMGKRSVYLDVFGNVRWIEDETRLRDSSPWSVVDGPASAVVGSTPEGQKDA